VYKHGIFQKREKDILEEIEFLRNEIELCEDFIIEKLNKIKELENELYG